MIVVRDPILQPIAITDLRPTQMTVGMREVNQKRDHLRTHVGKKIGKFLGGHMIPVVMGPRDRYYICLLYTSPSPRDGLLSRMPSSA